MTQTRGIDYGHAVRDAVLAGMVALLVFGPITGLQLSGYEVVARMQWPLLFAGIVTLGRFCMAVWVQTEAGERSLARMRAKRSGGVTVAEGKGKNWQQKLVPFALIGGLALPFILMDNRYWLTVVLLALIYVLLGLGLNIVVGLAGLLDLGYAAFYAVGAYVLAMGAQYWDMGFWGALVLAMVFGALLGMLLGFPVLRMHGDYLAIVTLGFHEIIRLILTNWVSFTGGPNGASAPLPTLFGLEFSRRAKQGGQPFHEFFGIDYSASYQYMFVYLILFLFVVAAIVFCVRLRQMPMGRAWEALREDEIACRSLGINHVTVKLSAFMMGAMFAGAAGVFFATYQGFVNPTSFTFIESAMILAIVVLGGLGSITGVVIAALVLIMLPEVLRDFASYRVLAFGIVMVLMMIWRPRGLMHIVRPRFTEKGA
ncbi:MAG: high-affinity branched-chain amino acid ABC transporter permease LivM [Rhodocyclales bacterium]|nr:high-affinity branched-chain amino acid ABC transporter permease LivM [Rhodocyclales bacterium]